MFREIGLIWGIPASIFNVDNLNGKESI